MAYKKTDIVLFLVTVHLILGSPPLN